MMNNTRDPTRLRMGLNPLLTTALNASNPQNTPLSALSMSSNHIYPPAPASAIQPYNPQQWIGSPIVGPERSLSFHHSHESQVAPLPPPPYSPPRSQRPVSIVMESAPSPANTSAARVPPSSMLRPSPEPVQQSQTTTTPTTTLNFPPPPNTGRGASRDRRFGLPSLGRRRDAEQSSSPPEPVPPVSISRPAHRNLSIQIPHQDLPNPYSSAAPVPPGSRRAVSVGDTPTSARSRSSSQVRWEPGMPLPPPPPGPPPSQSRSQSAQATDRNPHPIMSPPTRRPPPNGVVALGPVPPTPSDWVNDDTPTRPAREPSPHLTIDTSSISSSNQPEESTSGSSSGGGLARAHAMRRDKTIIQRRAESRTRGQRDSMDGVQLTDIVVPNGTTLSRRPTINRSTPRSGGRHLYDAPSTGGSQYGTRHVTPRPLGSGHLPNPDSPTPPFSPVPSKAVPTSESGPSSSVPKSLPTPPPQTRSTSRPDTRRGLVTPLGSARVMVDTEPNSPLPMKHIVIQQTADQFSDDTVERFRNFALKEAAAPSDADRVRLFADFIVSESRIRRERYAAVIGAMGSEIFDLTRDLFRPMSNQKDVAPREEYTPESSEPHQPRRESTNAAIHQEGPHPHSAPSSASIPISPAGAPPPTTNWGTGNYMPSLSPILSMSNSNAESDSRGRPASRWWESASGGAPETFGRSKRESKYMGVPKQAREALQWEESPTRSSSEMYAGSAEAGASSSTEYPQEKAGWHNSEPSMTPQPLRHSMVSVVSASQPDTPRANLLDISRLITLPPPYPRHHPAVNNNHPDLTATRTSVRALSDLTELTATKEKFAADMDAARQQLAQETKERQQTLRMDLQREIGSGRMSYADAAAIEESATRETKDKTKALDKMEFERFQSDVVAPLNELLTTRIAHATQLFDELASGLFSDVENAADMPQEEGDDKPELLEKLTLLKWIFEARETLHRGIFDILSDRNDRYRTVVLTPYRLSGNEEKIRSAEAFFADDASKREYALSYEVFQRTEHLREVVERAVLRGVEVQLSAFWDIAPPLSSVLDSIPQNLDGFMVQIPPSEYEENLSYYEHPLQYLFSLLLHSEKSSYQLIESQTNLLCLLHEVKEAVTRARARVLETELDGEGRPLPAAEREQRAEEMRRDEGRRLTDDLKEKVRVVQDQWTSALGESMKNVKERVGEWLLETGGWDEQFEDSGVGMA